MFGSQRRTPPDAFDAGLMVGGCASLVPTCHEYGATVWDCREVHRQLRLLAGLDPEDLEPSGNVR